MLKKNIAFYLSTNWSWCFLLIIWTSFKFFMSTTRERPKNYWNTFRSPECYHPTDASDIHHPQTYYLQYPPQLLSIRLNIIVGELVFHYTAECDERFDQIIYTHAVELLDKSMDNVVLSENQSLLHPGHSIIFMARDQIALE